MEDIILFLLKKKPNGIDLGIHNFRSLFLCIP